MKKSWLMILISMIIILSVLIVGFYAGIFEITGNVVSEQIPRENNQIGPSAEEQSCMMSCMKCSSPGVGCSGNQQECQTKCNLKKPEVTQETSCMEKCVLVGCGEYDFSCQGKNKEKCEKECEMIKELKQKIKKRVVLGNVLKKKIRV
jgi:hypothetical protein